MSLYAIKVINTIENRDKGINNYDTETLPFVYKSYTSAVEAIKGFVNAQVNKNGYILIDDNSCYFRSVNFTYTQNYQVIELIEMD